METPRQRQVREVINDLKLADGVANAMSARQRRREAKCALVGHSWREVTELSSECDRCGAMHHDEEDHA